MQDGARIFKQGVGMMLTFQTFPSIDVKIEVAEVQDPCLLVGKFAACVEMKEALVGGSFPP